MKSCNVDLQRFNKDFDIYCFERSALTKDAVWTNFKIRNDEEIEVVDKKWDPTIERKTVYIDSVYNYHFDYPLPDREDVVSVFLGDGEKVYSLRPEYLVSFKCFGYRGFRAKDFDDAMQILSSVALDKNYLWSLLRRTNYINLFPNEVNKKNLIYYLKNKPLHNEIFINMVKRHSAIVPFIDFSRIPYEYQVVLLYRDDFDFSGKDIARMEAIARDIEIGSEGRLLTSDIKNFFIFVLMHNIHSPNKEFIEFLLSFLYKKLSNQRITKETFFQCILYFGRHLYFLNDTFESNPELIKSKIDEAFSNDYLSNNIMNMNPWVV